MDEPNQQTLSGAGENASKSNGAIRKANSGKTPSKPLPGEAIDLETLATVASANGPVKNPKQARNYLHSKGYLTHDQDLTATSLAGVLFALVYQQNSSKRDFPNAVTAVAHLLQELELDKTAKYITEKVTIDVQKVIDGALSKQSESTTTNAKMLNATATTYADLTTKNTQNIQKLEEVCSRLTEITKPGAKPLYSTVASAMASAAPTAPVLDDRSARIRNKIAIQQRQFRFELATLPNEMQSLATDELKAKLNEILHALAKEESHKPSIRSVKDISPSAFLVEAADEQTTKWLSVDSNVTSLVDKLQPALKIIPRRYAIIARFVPVEWDPLNVENL
jgi:hypothetical protein